MSFKVLAIDKSFFLPIYPTVIPRGKHARYSGREVKLNVTIYKQVSLEREIQNKQNRQEEVLLQRSIAQRPQKELHAASVSMKHA